MTEGLAGLSTAAAAAAAAVLPTYDTVGAAAATAAITELDSSGGALPLEGPAAQQHSVGDQPAAAVDAAGHSQEQCQGAAAGAPAVAATVTPGGSALGDSLGPGLPNDQIPAAAGVDAAMPVATAGGGGGAATVIVSSAGSWPLQAEEEQLVIPDRWADVAGSDACSAEPAVLGVTLWMRVAQHAWLLLCWQCAAALS